MTRRADPAEQLVAAALEQAGAADTDPERLRVVAARCGPADPWQYLFAARSWLRAEVAAEGTLVAVVALGLVDAALALQQTRDRAPRNVIEEDN